jgi:DNA-binding transcriptional LysR family regulator
MRKRSPAAPTLDDLASLAAFVRVAEAGSFTAAARALGTTTSAISKRVARLEDRLGVRLVNRTSRRVALTEAGEALVERAGRVLAELEGLESDLGGAPQGHLRVNGPLVFGEQRLVPLLPAFMAKYPRIRVDLDLTDRFVDMVAERYDVAVRIGALADSSLMARRLLPSQLIACASPGYLAARGTPAKPMDLAAHDCISSSRMDLDPRREWLFRGPEGEVLVPVGGRLRSDHGGAMRAAAVAGLGIAVLPSFLIDEDLRTGALVAVLEGWRAPDLDVYAVYPAGKHVPPKVRAFVDFLVERLGEPGGARGGSRKG